MKPIMQRAAIVAGCFGLAYAMNRWPRATYAGLIGTWVVLGNAPKPEDEKP